jgi:hypothetical protein
MALLTNAARNRRYWLENFYEINRRAVEGWDRWPEAWVIPADQENAIGLANVLWILRMGDVEIHRAEAEFQAAGQSFAAGSYVIPMQQPYASFAQTLLERQVYPDLRQYPGGPPLAPYDVTAQTLPLLMDVEAHAVEQPVQVALGDVIPMPELDYQAPPALQGDAAPRIALFKAWDESIESGWTRWVLDQHEIAYDTLHGADIRGGALDDYDVILFQSQSPEAIVEGWSAEQMPEPYVGGLGQEGVAALRSFVEGGGRMVAVGDATAFAAETFELPVRSTVEGLEPSEFYIPGSILRLDLEPGHPLTQGLDPETIAWFWESSRAFDVEEGGNVEVLARYGSGDPRLSGWVLGAEHIAGQPAMLNARVGSGSVVLFGFQPDYRAQTIATWPLLFRALAGAAATSDNGRGR